jgi:hypothetical protein
MKKELTFPEKTGNSEGSARQNPPHRPRIALRHASKIHLGYTGKSKRAATQENHV